MDADGDGHMTVPVSAAAAVGLGCLTGWTSGVRWGGDGADEVTRGDDAQAWLERARVRHAARDWAGCVAAADAALARDSGCTEADLLRAVACFGTGRMADAADSLGRVLAVLPGDGSLQRLHARALMALGRFAEAAAPAREAARLLPDDADAHYLHGAAAKRCGRIDEAEAALARSLRLAPESADTLNDLADLRIARGDVAGALAHMRHSHAIRPYNLDALSGLTFYAAFEEGVTAEGLFALNRDWSRRLEAEAASADLPPPAPARADGRISLAYLAYDLFDHVTSWFLEPVLARHDRGRFHLSVYAGNDRADGVTHRLRGCVDRWCDISGLSVTDTARRIRADGVDILVLASFFRGRDRRVMAHRAAPVQVGYHNRVATSGLTTMDYIVTEAISDPPGEVEGCYTENLVHITNHNVYLPPPNAPAPGLPPCLAAGHVTFASFNNHAKITDGVVDAWARILDAVPGARLLMRSSTYFDNAATCAYFRSRFAIAGADTKRIIFEGFRSSRTDHLAGIAAADIALDPFPCNGGTTSCETLWMGLPLVTLETPTYMGRQGASYLAKLGLLDLVARDRDGYVAVATALAADTARLGELRASLRQRVAAAMFDYDQHVLELETAYATMMALHAQGHPPQPFTVRNGTVHLPTTMP